MVTIRMPFSRFALIAVALASAQGVSAGEPASVELRPGEALTLTLDDGGVVAESRREAVPALSPFEAAAAFHLTNGTYQDASGPNSAAIVAGEHNIPEPPPIAPGGIRVKMLTLGDSGTMLILENGYSAALSYRARIRSRGRSEYTDVCQVLPQKFSFEHWPYAIERIELSQLRHVPWVEGRAPVCE